jgi:alpha-L-rhamnosidase
MWVVVELKDYFYRTGDRALVDEAKERVYNLIKFFDKYVNEFGLLENLESWVFIEWSVCNTPEYISGVNFPSNMLFAHMLKCVYELYGDEQLKLRSEKILKTVESLSYNGKFFRDNTYRNEKDELICYDEHTSETCQYYALYMGLCPDEEFKERMIKEFGPLRKDAYPEVGRCNMFIGNYLRFLWLCDVGEYDRVVDECLEYFAIMAEKTGTLWEHDSPHASCNHGFASVASVILLRCVSGYLTVKDNKPVFDEKFVKGKDYGVEIEFDY